MDLLEAALDYADTPTLPTLELPAPIVGTKAGWGLAFEDFSMRPDEPHLLLQGDALAVLRELPSGSVDFAMTSPPYWGLRQYDEAGLGLEESAEQFLVNLSTIFGELHRVLKDSGSFWLNIGDTYSKKSLMGIPWRLALRLIDEQGWILRNEVIWNKLKGGMDTSKDRLSNTHEQLFHFVKSTKGYYYDVDSIRSKPRSSKVKNGSVVSATGVSGVRYKRQIELSTALDDDEKLAASKALDAMLNSIAAGEYSDFRMVIRGQQRSTHSDQSSVSGRAKELNQKGFYFLRYHPKGSKPSDVWDIIPEDTQSRKNGHFAAYPIDLCRIPLLSTCPPDGIAIDPFCGTGTTLVAAHILGRRSVGIDISESYIAASAERLVGVK